MYFRWYVTTAILTMTCFAPAKAASITIGASDTDRTFPFDQYTGEYQQIYSSAVFSGPIDIGSITFFAALDNPNDIISGTYTLSLSTTSKAVNGLSSTFSDNVGPDSAVFFNGSVSNTLTFTGTPFLYNPSNGSLLLDIFVTSNSGTGTGFASGGFLAGGISPDTSRLRIIATTDAVGLETQFSTLSASGVPEPSCLLQLGTGLLILSVLAFKRRRWFMTSSQI